MEIYIKNGESGEEYRKRELDPISKSFCGAKWYNATIWLNSGQTTSCHHPPAHTIPLEELKKSIKALHNTSIKKEARQEMLDGKYPSECDYCWKVEKINSKNVSDRVFKSILYSSADLQKCVTEFGSQIDVDLQTLEIAFDAHCNFACSYCNASFSTSWQRDIKMNGKYINLESDGKEAYMQDGSWAIPYGLKNEGNPYIEAFWKWWEGDLQNSLRQLRVTGGEITMSPDFWKLMEWWENNPNCKIEFAANSNLGSKPQLIKRLAKVTHSFKHFELYTSNEAFGSHAEYIRDGLVWNEWIDNIHIMMRDGKLSNLHMMMTINALCLFSITEFMEEMFKIKEEYKSSSPFMSFNILRFPSFMAIPVLPKHIRLDQANKIEKWFNDNCTRAYFQQAEKDGLSRLIDYIRKIDVGHDNTSSLSSREHDFKEFFSQYDVRRNKNFLSTFDNQPALTEWYNTL